MTPDQLAALIGAAPALALAVIYAIGLACLPSLPTTGD
jgi:hypothetical protein